MTTTESRHISGAYKRLLGIVEAQLGERPVAELVVRSAAAAGGLAAPVLLAHGVEPLPPPQRDGNGPDDDLLSLDRRAKTLTFGHRGELRKRHPELHGRLSTVQLVIAALDEPEAARLLPSADAKERLESDLLAAWLDDPTEGDPWTVPPRALARGDLAEITSLLQELESDDDFSVQAHRRRVLQAVGEIIHGVPREGGDDEYRREVVSRIEAFARSYRAENGL